MYGWGKIVVGGRGFLKFEGVYEREAIRLLFTFFKAFLSKISRGIT